eukprot:36299-Prymnesium_polylepis.1
MSFVFALLTFGSAAALRAPLHAPSTPLLRAAAVRAPHGVRLMALPEAVADAAAAKRITRPDERNWDKLVELYASDELALAACRQNAMILSSMFANPELLEESYEALVLAMGGSNEAREIMLKNPSVLTCGAGIANSSADEIRTLANFRNAADSIPPSALWAVLLGSSAFIGYKIALVQGWL